MLINEKSVEQVNPTAAFESWISPFFPPTFVLLDISIFMFLKKEVQGYIKIYVSEKVGFDRFKSLGDWQVPSSHSVSLQSMS